MLVFRSLFFLAMRSASRESQLREQKVIKLWLLLLKWKENKKVLIRTIKRFLDLCKLCSSYGRLASQVEQGPCMHKNWFERFNFKKCYTLAHLFRFRFESQITQRYTQAITLTQTIKYSQISFSVVVINYFAKRTHNRKLVVEWQYIYIYV